VTGKIRLDHCQDVIPGQHGSNCRKHIRDESRFTAGQHSPERCHELDPFVECDDRVDFSQLDAEATDLDLGIGPSDVFDATIAGSTFRPPHHVPRAVHSFTLCPKGIRDESIGRHTCQIVVSARNLRPCKIELTRSPRRYRLQAGIQYQRRCTTNRTTDRDGITRAEFRHVRDDRHLGRAVRVDKVASGRPLRDQLWRTRFTRDHDDSNIVESRWIHRCEHRRSSADMRHSLCLDQLG